MGAKISKRYSYKSQPKVFNLLLNILLNGPHKRFVLDFRNFTLRFFKIFFSFFLT